MLLFKAAGAVARWASKLKAVLKVKNCLQLSSNPILRRIQKFLNPHVACFLAGTPVWVLEDGIDPDAANAALADGADYRDYAITRPIEEIVVGDYALSRPDTDPDGPLSFERVVAAVDLFHPRFDRLCGPASSRRLAHGVSMQRYWAPTRSGGQD